MIERLALPAWNTPPTPLESWVEALRALGHDAEVERESTGVSWLTLGPLLARGYAVMRGKEVEAINFELAGPHPDRTLEVLEHVVEQLGWELHDEADDPDDDES